MYIQHIGAIKIKQLAEITTEDRMIRFHVQVCGGLGWEETGSGVGLVGWWVRGGWAPGGPTSSVGVSMHSAHLLRTHLWDWFPFST